MRKTTPQSILAVIMIAVTTVFVNMLLTETAMAATFTWDGGTTTDADWTLPDNWVNGTSAPANDGTADILFDETNDGAADGSAGSTVNVDTAQTISSLTFDDPYTLSGSAINLAGTASVSHNDSGASVISSNMQLQADATITVNDAAATPTGSLELSGTISEDATGNRALTFLFPTSTTAKITGSSNSYTGGTTFGRGLQDDGNGTIEFSSSDPFGSGDLTADPGRLRGVTLKPTTSGLSISNDWVSERHLYFDVSTADLTLTGDIVTTTNDFATLGASGGSGTLNVNGSITDQYTGTNHKQTVHIHADVGNTISLNNANTFPIGAAIQGGSGTDTGTINIGHPQALGDGSQPVYYGKAYQNVTLTSSIGTVDVKDLTIGYGVTVNRPNLTVGTDVRLTGTIVNNDGADNYSRLEIGNGGTMAASGSMRNPAAGHNWDLTVISGGTVTVADDSPGLLECGDLSFADNTAELIVDLSGLDAGTGYDQIAVLGDASDTVGVTLGNATLTLQNLAWSIPESTLMFIITNDGSDAVIGTFDGLAQDAMIDMSVFGGQAGSSAQISYLGDSVGGTISGGNDVVLYNFVGIPEPSAALLLLLGGVAVINRRRVTKA